jgi:tRNA A37 threonylcarbamoyladenosine synthetase subunit TsaC/SUA5/YrdC
MTNKTTGEVNCLSISPNLIHALLKCISLSVNFREMIRKIIAIKKVTTPKTLDLKVNTIDTKKKIIENVKPNFLFEITCSSPGSSNLVLLSKTYVKITPALVNNGL